MSLWDDDDDGDDNGYRFGWASSRSSFGFNDVSRGEISTVIHLTSDNRETMIGLVERHFAQEDVAGIGRDTMGRDVIEIKAVPRNVLTRMLEAKGGKGSVEIIENGREKSPYLDNFRFTSPHHQPGVSQSHSRQDDWIYSSRRSRDFRW